MKRKITAKLIQWKSHERDRMPMLIHGARQVGKTYAIQQFGKEFYKNVVYVNFELDAAIIPYFESTITPERILSILEKYFHTKIEPTNTPPL